MLASTVPSCQAVRAALSAAVGLALLSATGCTGSSSPATTPANLPASSGTPPTIAPSIDTLAAGDLRAGIATLGLYDYRIDAASGAFSLTPARAVQAVGDAFTLDLTSAFTTNAFGCAACLQITGLERTGPGELSVNFRARHPFGDTLTSGRADLHVNNIRLVFLENGSDAFFGSGQAAVTGQAGLVANANGYVTLPATFVTPPVGLTASLFPFVIFETGDPLGAPTGNFNSSTGWSGVLNAPEGYNVFAQGATAGTDVVFDLTTAGSNVLEGQLALLGNFIVSAGNRAQRPAPDYYMPEGAMPEAWNIAVTAPSTFTADPVQQIDSVIVEVADWQHGGTVDAGFPGTDRNGLRASGDVQSVHVSIPAFGSTEFTSSTPTSGTGSIASPLVFDIAVTKPASYTTAGDLVGLVKVIDSRTDFNAIDESLNAGTGISQLAEVASYQTFRLNVINSNNPPTCSGYTLNGTAPGGAVQLPFGFNAGVAALAFDFTNDTDGTIVNVDVDWTYDGSTFNVEGNLTVPGTLNAPVPYTGPATLAVRFTDDDGASTVCTTAITIFSPTTTVAPSTAYIGPSQFSNVSANGTDMSLARIPVQMVSHGNNVYVVCRNDNSSGTITYIARSTDGGQTFPAGSGLQISPGLAAGGTFKFNALSLALNADGTALAVYGINNAFGSNSSGNGVLSRINTSTFTLDATIRGINLDDAVNGFEPTFNSFESVVLSHPTDPEVLFVLSDDTTTRMARLCRIGNFKSATVAGLNVGGSISIARAGGTGNAAQVNGITATSLFDPVMYLEPTNNQIHIVAQGGSGVPSTGYLTYRKYLVAGDVFEGAGETQFYMAETGQAEREPGVVAGTDGRAIVVSRSDGSAGQDKAMITKAGSATPPYNFAPSKRLVPTWATSPHHNQEKPSVAIDRATGNIFVAVADTRDNPGESTPDSSISIWEMVFDNNLNCLINGRKMDAPGLTDNQDNDRTARVYITQDGAPTTKRWLYYWQDASRKNVAGQPDLLVRTVQ